MDKSALFRKLRQKLISAALASKEFREKLKIAADEINMEAKKAANEATIEGIFERIVYGLLKVSCAPRKKPGRPVRISARWALQVHEKEKMSIFQLRRCALSLQNGCKL
jgi:hypothetical protein